MQPRRKCGACRISPLQMLAVAGGRERTLREWEQLLAFAGFRLRRLHRLRALAPLLEAQAV